MKSTMEVFTPGNDCVVTERANARLRMSAYSPVRQVACAFDKGVLVLRGRLRSFFHKQIAQETVANLEGVRQIRNEIEVFSLTG